MNYEFFLVSSLEKVFPGKRPEGLSSRLSAWKGTRASVQLVYGMADVPGFMPMQEFTLEVTGGPVPCTWRRVELMPSDFPVYGTRDDNYLTDQPGLFPDLLEPMQEHTVTPIPGQYRSLWLSWEIPEEAEAGDYSIHVIARAVERRNIPNGTVLEDPAVRGLVFDLPFTLHVGKTPLQPQSLIHTEWFHADCLANYYHTPVFSEEHWQILENFISAARRHDVNMLLTPVFTPPLDTARGGQRTTVQLVDVIREQGKYRFHFEKLLRWTELCKKYGIRYLEIAHFFTQWGACAAPKVMATVDGQEQQLFGWQTRATGEEYRQFLQALVPALRQVLEQAGYDREHVFFHISDEPSLAQLESYQAARDMVKDLIPESQIVDALSSLEFYRKGIAPHPIPETNAIEEFHRAGVPGLWAYYCCAQCQDVPNRFFSMPSARNRIMGVLMYLYDIQGFLHWGFNFYSSKYSFRSIDPFRNTHADYGFPSGDAFLVYPGPEGTAWDSIRAEVQDEGLLDLRALRQLERLTSREFVTELIGADTGALSFTKYPHDAAWLLNLRERVAMEIDKRS